jgi:hypothetical protein
MSLVGSLAQRFPTDLSESTGDVHWPLRRLGEHDFLTKNIGLRNLDGHRSLKFRTAGTKHLGKTALGDQFIKPVSVRKRTSRRFWL